jgi:hypothetical protein
MDRPLWRIFLNVMLLAFVAQRGGVLAMAVLAHASPWFIAGLGLQCAAGLCAAIAVWIGRRMQESLIALGAMVVLTAVLQIAALGTPAVPAAIGQALAAVLSIAGLIFLLRHMPEGE